jgi:hypothetical protein
MKKLAVFVLWCVCGFVNWGLTLGSFTHEFPTQSHTGIASFAALMGPPGLLAILFCSSPYHWRVKPMTTEERWNAFEYKDLGRAYWEQHYN